MDPARRCAMRVNHWIRSSKAQKYRFRERRNSSKRPRRVKFKPLEVCEKKSTVSYRINNKTFKAIYCGWRALKAGRKRTEMGVALSFGKRQRQML